MTIAIEIPRQGVRAALRPRLSWTWIAGVLAAGTLLWLIVLPFAVIFLSSFI